MITKADLKFIGAINLPTEAMGHSTAYAPGCLALRRVNDQVRLFTDVHIESGGKVYEINEAGKKVKDWGYVPHPTKPADLSAPMTGLRWDPIKKALYYSFGYAYHNGPAFHPTYGTTSLPGMIKSVPQQAAFTSLWTRGGTLDIPAGFASKYTGGIRLGVGFGGYYSIFNGGSYGPFLSAGPKIMLCHPAQHKAPRPGNYHHAVPGTWMGENPIESHQGTWNGGDEIGGENHAAGAVWISTQLKQGVLFFASLGTGKIAYIPGGIEVEGRSNYLYVYNPSDLGKVAQGALRPWEPVPKIYPFDPPTGFARGARAAGVAFDQATQKLYVCFTDAVVGEFESFPKIAVYQL